MLTEEVKTLEIYKYGSSILRETMRPVEEMSADLLSFIENMFHTMYEEEGIGLSANQVGSHLHVCVIGASLLEELDLDDFVIINGEILDSSGSCTAEEGCLSFPDIHEEVTRPDRINLRYQDENLEVYEKEFEGYIARVIQHELDHLNGVYFIDRISALRRKLLKKQLTQISETQKHHK
ncbi:MAG: peptide deformylase [Candidatus Marinimicrobia bacterium]|nr:peptide deformylase [Candidatus Neomarinimicrobiota bacterium]